MNEKAEIILTRTIQTANSRRHYDVYINNLFVDKIADGEEKSFEVSPGEKDIYLRLDWAKSKKMTFSLKPGENKRLLCGSRLKGPLFLLTLFYLFTNDKLVYLEEYDSQKAPKMPKKTKTTWKD